MDLLSITHISHADQWNFIGFLKNGSSFKEEEVTLCSFSYPVNEREGGRDSVVVIATRYRLDGPGGEIVPVQTGPEAHPASCTVGTWSFPGGKAAGAWC